MQHLRRTYLMVKIRLARIGRRNSPYYRIVVSDSRRTPHAESLDDLGHYDPLERQNSQLVINEELAIKWLLRGAIPSDSVKTLLKKQGVYAKLLAQKAEAKKTK